MIAIPVGSGESEHRVESAGARRSRDSRLQAHIRHPRSCQARNYTRQYPDAIVWVRRSTVSRPKDSRRVVGDHDADGILEKSQDGVAVREAA